jgi:hypothetical protein
MRRKGVDVRMMSIVHLKDDGKKEVFSFGYTSEWESRIISMLQASEDKR